MRLAHANNDAGAVWFLSSSVQCRYMHTDMALYNLPRKVRLPKLVYNACFWFHPSSGSDPADCTQLLLLPICDLVSATEPFVGCSWNSVWGVIYKNSWTCASFVKIYSITNAFLMCKNEFLPLIPIFSWPIRVKFGIVDLHVLRLSNCEFHENRWNEKPRFTLEYKLIWILTLHIRCPIRVKVRVKEAWT